MLIIGCDYHPSVQQIAFVDTETGECQERRLAHCADAEHFYRELKQRGMSVRLGIEATGQSRWFERLLAELGFEVWIGDPARIRAKQVRKQKNDRMDAAHLLKLMLKDDFPRIWVPSPENRDVRQLVWHRHRLVQMRSRVMNQLQAIAMNEGVRRKRGLWTQQGRAQLEALRLPDWTHRRRQELLELLDRFDPSIDQLTEAIEQEAERRPEVERLQTHPGVGPITALAQPKSRSAQLPAWSPSPYIAKPVKIISSPATVMNRNMNRCASGLWPMYFFGLRSRNRYQRSS